MNDKKFENIIKNLEITHLTENFILYKVDLHQHSTIKISDIFIKIKNDINNDQLWKIFITNVIYSITYINNSWYISIKIFIKRYYESIVNYLQTSNVIKNCKFILNIISKYFITEKVKLQKTNNNSLSWCAKVEYEDIVVLLDQKIYHYKLFNKPRDWVYIDEQNVYLDEDFNKSLLSNGKFIQNWHIKALYNEQFVKIINNLQQIYHQLDINLFINTFENNDLLKFYSKDDKYNKHINIEYYKNLTKYFDKTKFKDIFQFYNYMDKNVIDYNTFIISKSYSDISPSEKIILNFLYNYNNEKIFNNLVCDYRGRIYIQNIISYISSKLYRFLITLNPNHQPIINDFYKYYLACQYSKNVKSINDGIQIYNNIINTKNFEYKNINNKFLFNKIFNFENFTITLDATSSMLQILALITKDEKLMKYTNLHPNNDRLDVYDYIIQILTDCYKNDIFINHYTNRNLVKYSIMLYIYGSTPLFTATKLNIVFNLKTIFYKDLTTIINNILKIFKQEFKSITDLKQIIKLFIKHTNNDNTTTITSLIKKITYSCPKEKKIILKTNTIYTEFFTDSQNPSKKQRKKSLFVNMIHTFDSEICILTRNNLLEKKIYTLSIHDCFITHINNYHELLLEYNKNLTKIYYLSILDILPKINEISKIDNNLKKKIDTYMTKYEINKTNIQLDNCYYTLKPE